MSARAGLGSIRFARLIHELGSGKSCSLAVASLADLDHVDGRSDVLAMCREVDGAAPIVLLSEKAVPRSDAAFQALAHLTWLVGREMYIAPNAAAVARMVFARQAKAQGKLVASVTAEGGQLTVWSCEPRRYSVVASEVPALARLSAKQLADVELNESGSRMRWSAHDIDLDLEAIVAYADPDVRRKHESLRRNEAVRYAQAIGELRAEYGLKQTSIAGLSERQVRRLEQGDTLPHSSTLKKLAAAHELSVEAYLAELAKRSGKRPRSYAAVSKAGKPRASAARVVKVGGGS